MKAALVALAAIPVTSACSAPQSPKVGCVSAILIEETTGRVLWKKNADLKCYPASTTKMMTALLMIEQVGADTVITAPAMVRTVKPSSLHLQPGEQLTMKNLLYGLLLRSANDAGVMAAHHISGSVASFGKLMTQRAREIGCTATNFTNPHGLHDPKHYTTARDLSMIAQKAMSYPMFREAVRTPTWWLTRSANQKDLLVESHNNLLTEDLTYDGIKTGYTKPAGRCLVASATRDGMRLISVVMNAEDRNIDTKTLMDWGFKYYNLGAYVRKGDTVTICNVKNGAVEKVAAVASEDVTGVVRKDGSEQPTLTMKIVEAPIEAGQVVATAKYEGGKSIPLLAKEAVARKLPGEIVTGAFGAMFVGGYMLIRRKRTRIYENN